MFNSQSQFSTFGWWVAWVYLLSLSGIVAVPPIPPLPPLPSIAFVERGITVTEKDGTVIEEVEATVRLSRPAEAELPVSIDYLDNSAKLGQDFDVQASGKAICFQPGEQEKVIRFGRPRAEDASIQARDVTIVGPTKPAPGPVVGDVEDRSFIVCLKGNPALQPVGDTGRMVVTILRADRVAPSQPRAAFAGPAVEAEEKALPGLPIALNFDRPLPESAKVRLSLYRRDGDQRELVETIDRTVKAGEKGMAMQLDTLFSSGALQEHRVVDDRFPEADEHYELELMSSDVFPGEPLALTALNDDDELRVRVVPVKSGDAFRLVDNGPDWDDAEDRWWQVRAKLPDGEEVDFGPVRRGGPEVRLPDHVLEKWKGRRISYDVAHSAAPAGQGRCQKKGSGCCRGGGTPKGQAGKGSCGAGSCLCGPAVPGDYLLIVVNNERLHEPGDEIVDKVKEALADESAQPYGNGAIIVNPEDEDTMTAESGEPKKEKMFQPFERDGQDVAGQLKRVEEVIAKKREAAEREDLRAVVVWPERDLASGTGLKPVEEAAQQPVSFIFPGADPSYARNMRALVPPKAPAGGVTIRSPRESELPAHLINVMRESRTGRPESGGTPAADETPPRDSEEALKRATG